MALSAKPKKPAAHHRKLQAGHHRPTKHYAKTYWPYLPMLMMVVIGLAINSFWATQSRVLGAASDFSAVSLLAGTNDVRSGDKELPLTISNKLTTAAQAKADDMVAKDYWSHNTPDGKAPWTFIAATGYSYQQAGENLAYGFNSSSATITGWMNSAEHRDNILNSVYKQVGFGIASSPNYQNKGPSVIVVALYANPAAAAANITFTVPDPAARTDGTVLGNSVRSQPDSHFVSRIQILTGGKAPWSLVALSTLAIAALVVFIFRHGRRLKKLFVEGEVFISHHPVFDILVVFVFTAGYVLTRSSGIIR